MPNTCCSSPNCWIAVPDYPCKDEKGRLFCSEDCKRETRILEQRAKDSSEAQMAKTSPENGQHHSGASFD